MKIRCISLFIPALLALLIIGCATIRDTQTQQQTQNFQRDTGILSVTNAEPGSTYDVSVYLVKVGDTAAMIAARHQMSLQELKTINPDLDPRRIFVGKQIRIYEKKSE
jgi:LysM repeat protein